MPSSAIGSPPPTVGKTLRSTVRRLWALSCTRPFPFYLPLFGARGGLYVLVVSKREPMVPQGVLPIAYIVYFNPPCRLTLVPTTTTKSAAAAAATANHLQTATPQRVRYRNN